MNILCVLIIPYVYHFVIVGIIAISNMANNTIRVVRYL
ncbi:hypothetical protein MVUOKPPV_CDS0312 [Klebsiella phage phi1_175008]|uniref:Uncharacterized protein n=1 Tax=Klebsiella phage phi1_175008 TaxID=3127744 RepID=A0ACD5FRJ2_9CAUD